MDAIDRRILRALHRNARLTNAELAEEVGLSPSPCWTRVKRLEHAGFTPEQAIQMLTFATLSALGRAMDAARFSSLESFFGFLMFGFYAYMVFDSYHTAKSRHRQS